VFRVFGDSLVKSVQIGKRKTPTPIGFGVVWITVASFLILLNGRLMLPLSGKYKPPAVVIVFDVFWLGCYGFLELLDCLGIFFLFGKRPTPTLVNVDISRINVTDFLIFLDRRFIMTLGCENQTPTMKKAFNLVWPSRDSYFKLLDRCFILFIIRERPTPSVIILSRVCIEIAGFLIKPAIGREMSFIENLIIIYYIIFFTTL